MEEWCASMAENRIAILPGTPCFVCTIAMATDYQSLIREFAVRACVCI
jgi:hypothetical protein